MARPKRNTEQIATYVAPEIFTYYKEKADESGMDLSAYIRMILTKHKNDEEKNKE